ncbi:type IX secretion system membrane protein PorP/SprF [Aquimarina sp. U1-2]|uniref:PorP/SprF family type IX secretion system membrane protein n=1 Tax=Aquimarina sp. U1-2 TaxID=2823141 RepID=UPI001AECD0F5|nr:type IX secretion system membrane protein PorP/SprF [Aquimarina sp. U1-2]MBP2831834.1 type IX secretion system membrane protein PorP/SprF [Aquimarina sp. U1-2]
MPHTINDFNKRYTKQNIFYQSLQQKLINFGLHLTVFLIPLFNNAQQNPQFSQYLQNPYVINPAMTGVEDYAELTAAYRNQWTGFDGAPRTATFSFNSSLHLLQGRLQRRGGESHQGVGAFLYTDNTGPINQNGFYGSYAYHLKISRDWFLSVGAFAGVNQFSYDASEAVLIQNPNDILVNSFSDLNFDMSLGLYVYSNYLFAGVAANQLFDNEIPYDIENGVLTNDGRLNRNFNFLVGSRIDLNQNFEIVPSILVKTVVGAPIQWDINGKLVYQDKLWGGLAYRNQDALIGFFGMKVLQNFLVSYSYDWSLTEFSGQQSGTHEVILSYRFDFGNQKCACPQYSM